MPNYPSYTLHSKFGTRYGSGDKENVFEGFESFVDQFARPSDLDQWIEAQSEDDAEQDGDAEREGVA